MIPWRSYGKNPCLLPGTWGCREAIPCFRANLRSPLLVLWAHQCLFLATGPGTLDGFIQSDALILNDSPEPLKAQQGILLSRSWSSDVVMGFHSWGEAGLLWEWVTWLGEEKGPD